MSQSPSFGTMIRAGRLGWGLSHKHGAFIRIWDEPNGKIVVELHPTNGVPKYKTDTGHHRVWWETPAILDMIPWLRGVTRIKKYVRVTVNDEGIPQ